MRFVFSVEDCIPRIAVCANTLNRARQFFDQFGVLALDRIVTVCRYAVSIRKPNLRVRRTAYLQLSCVLNSLLFRNVIIGMRSACDRRTGMHRVVHRIRFPLLTEDFLRLLISVYCSLNSLFLCCSCIIARFELRMLVFCKTLNAVALHNAALLRPVFLDAFADLLLLCLTARNLLLLLCTKPFNLLLLTLVFVFCGFLLPKPRFVFGIDTLGFLVVLCLNPFCFSKLIRLCVLIRHPSRAVLRVRVVDLPKPCVVLSVRFVSADSRRLFPSADQFPLSPCKSRILKPTARSTVLIRQRSHGTCTVRRVELLIAFRCLDQFTDLCLRQMFFLPLDDFFDSHSYLLFVVMAYLYCTPRIASPSSISLFSIRVSMESNHLNLCRIGITIDGSSESV